MSVYNDPNYNGNTNIYDMLNDNISISPGNSSNAVGFSMKKWRKNAVSNNYSFENIPLTAFNNFKDKATKLYGYKIS